MEQPDGIENSEKFVRSQNTKVLKSRNTFFSNSPESLDEIRFSRYMSATPLVLFGVSAGTRFLPWTRTVIYSQGTISQITKVLPIQNYFMDEFCDVGSKHDTTRHPSIRPLADSWSCKRKYDVTFPASRTSLLNT